ncbi:putative membrane protein [Streptococcus oralis]|nr:putative membrane protein [Streptococcus oralis]
MAPKSPHAFKKWHRLVAETSIFILVSGSFWHLYGLQIGILYLALSFGSLVLLYYFQLE